MKSTLRLTICSFILVLALYRVPYHFKTDFFHTKSHYFYYLGNYNIYAVYTHVIQWDLHNMKGISALNSRTTCTTSQELVSGYSFNPSISFSHVKAPSELSFIRVTATQVATA